MEESLTRVEEGLPAVEVPEAVINRLTEARDRMTVESAPPPDAPPPITLEQLVSAEATMAERRRAAKERKKARKQLEKVYKQEAAKAVKAEAAHKKAEKSETSEEPIEADYEKRAEIRTEPAPTAEEQGLAQSIGQIISDLQKKTAAAHKLFGKPKPARAKPWQAPVDLFKKQPGMYQQAILAGFAGAILATGIIVTLVS